MMWPFKKSADKPAGKRKRKRPALDQQVFREIELHTLLSYGVVVTTPVVGFFLAKSSKAYVVYPLLATVLALAIAARWLGEAKANRAENERVDAAAETIVALGDVLDPIMIEMGKLVALPTPERRGKRSGMVELILSGATGLGPSESRPRACYFKLSADQRCLEHELSRGRSVAAKARFEAGTEHGDSAIGMVTSEGHLFCQDVLKEPPPGWVPSERGEYRTFISVTVSAGGTVYGMLALDAQTPGSLTAEDVHSLRVLGHILGTAEALTA